MSRTSITWVITTLAIYQTRFWAEVPTICRNRVSQYILSFDDRSSEYLTANKFRVYSTCAMDKQKAERLMHSLEASLEEYGINNLNFWLTHERFAFDLRNSQEMSLRLLTYLVLADRSLAELSKDGQLVMIQELGGFISVIASFFSARKQNIDNWFVEPSFYRGRQFFLKNRFGSMEIPSISVKAASTEVKAYLSEVQTNKTIVVPVKDRHHYSAPLYKILIRTTFDDLVRKSLINICWVSTKSLVTSAVTFSAMQHATEQYAAHRKIYRDAKAWAFCVLPLHVPGDMALTLRSPQFLDQLGLIDYLLRNHLTVISWQ